MKPCKINCGKCGDFVRKSTEEELNKILEGGIVWAICDKCISFDKEKLMRAKHREYLIASLATPMSEFVASIVMLAQPLVRTDCGDIKMLSESFITLMETYEENK